MKIEWKPLNGINLIRLILNLLNPLKSLLNPLNLIKSDFPMHYFLSG